MTASRKRTQPGRSLAAAPPTSVATSGSAAAWASAAASAPAATPLAPRVAKDGVPAFVPEHPTTLTFHCSDGRFTAAVEWLMRQERVSRYDIVAMPGGPALLDMAGATILEAEASRAGMSFLIQGHRIRQAYLIAHAGCGFYDKRLAGRAPEKILERQVLDLQVAAAWLRRVHPTVAVHAFMARIESTRTSGQIESQVAFERIELDDQATPLLL